MIHCASDDEINAVFHDGSECLRLPRHCDEGKQDGDDGLLHIRFVLEFSAAKLKQSAQKALGKVQKSGAEGESLKLLKEICAIFSYLWLHRTSLTLGEKHRRILRLDKKRTSFFVLCSTKPEV